MIACTINWPYDLGLFNSVQQKSAPALGPVAYVKGNRNSIDAADHHILSDWWS
jgi:hypothetical protein